MNYNLEILKGVLQTSVLSDVLDEFDINGMLSSKFEPNFFDAKLFGRAKTIKVEAIREGDDPNGIYDGLNIFETIESGDVIIVSNEVKELAYWGEMNTNLAIRSGAVGTIVDSVTRDNYQTRRLGYPVFAKGRYAKDIKSRGTVRGLNVPVEVDNVQINPGDLIFADVDGVIVIPKNIEEKVIKRALEIVETEKNIVRDVARKLDAKALIDSHGTF